MESGYFKMNTFFNNLFFAGIYPKWQIQRTKAEYAYYH
jgi:hypothetical protein